MENEITNETPGANHENELTINGLQYLHDYKLQMTLSNGAEKILDLKQFLFNEKRNYNALFEILKDKGEFEKAYLWHGIIRWGDIDFKLKLDTDGVIKGDYDLEFIVN